MRLAIVVLILATVSACSGEIVVNSSSRSGPVYGAGSDADMLRQQIYGGR